MDQNIKMTSDKSHNSGREEAKGGNAEGQENGGGKYSKYYPDFLKKATHPGVCIWHFLFKAAALMSYFFLNLFISNTVMTFISVILLSSFDFWVVKNITGRILVGLRWWSQVKDDGTEEWYFESLEEKKNTGIDSFIFWAVLYIAPIVWGILVVANVLSFSIYNVTLCLSACVLAGTNLYGYIKCERDHKGKVSGFLMNQAMSNLDAKDVVRAAGYAAKMGTGK